MTEIPAKCFDCGELYGSPRFQDLVLPHDVWAKISPNGDSSGLLCPNCICARLVSAGIEEVEASFTSGPFMDPGKLKSLKRIITSWGIPEEENYCCVCGKTTPCELDKDPMSPCTFSPTYKALHAAYELHRRKTGELSVALSNAEVTLSVSEAIFSKLREVMGVEPSDGVSIITHVKKACDGSYWRSERDAALLRVRELTEELKRLKQAP